MIDINNNHRCIEMKKMSGSSQWRWQDEDCASQRAFICQIDPCPGEPKYTDGGLGFDYQFFEQKLDQTEAHLQCVKRNAGLPSIHSLKEMEFIEGIICNSVDRIWIGMSDPNNNKADVTWLDMSPRDFVPTNAAGFVLSSPADKCVQLAMDNSVWVWKDVDCDEKLSFICKRDIDECAKDANLCISKPNTICVNTIGNYSCDCKPGFQTGAQGGQSPGCTDTDECATPDICSAKANTVCVNTKGSYTCDCKTGFTRATTNGSCEITYRCEDVVNWLQDLAISNSEFMYVRRGKSIANAQMYCINYGGHLASIHSEAENKFLTKWIEKCENSSSIEAWIGLRDSNDNNASTFWIDNSPTDWHNPGMELEPNPAGRYKSEYLYFTRVNGLWIWADGDSWLKRFFFCKRAPRTLPCPSGLHEYEINRSYQYFDIPVSQNEASVICENMEPRFGTLVTIGSGDEQKFIEGIVCNTTSAVWIGLKDDRNDKTQLTWLDGSWSSWQHDQSKIDLTDRRKKCVAMKNEPTGSLWTDYHCDNETLPFICKLKRCAGIGWRQEWHGKWQYRYFVEKMNQTSAQAHCVANGANLTSIHDEKENRLVERYM
ncbi:C-type mannose receptor 2-like [Lineus longissimus]|uniref:C-type mannose receptor 2-like n=1 Tax=Lineus longissimus TaxID=88925 RepID=UPI00315D432E